MLTFRTSTSVQTKYRSQIAPRVTLDTYVSNATTCEPTKKCVKNDEWTTVVKKSRPVKDNKKRSSMVLPVRPSSKVVPFPMLSTKKVAPNVKSMTGWAAIVSKRPECFVEEQKSELMKMREEMTRLKEHIVAAKESVKQVDVVEETRALRDEFKHSGMFVDSDGESMCWGDMVDDEFGLE